MKTIKIYIILFFSPIPLIAQNPFDKTTSVFSSLNNKVDFKLNTNSYNGLRVIKGNQYLQINGISAKSINKYNIVESPIMSNSTSSSFSILNDNNTNTFKRTTFKQSFPAYKDPTKRWHYKFVDNCD